MQYKYFTLFIFTLFSNLTGISQANFDYTPTSQSALFRGQATIDGITATANDSIAAFDAEGNCAGATALTIFEDKAYINLVIYGDDAFTSEDEGINIGEYFTLKLYDASSNTIIDYNENGEIVEFTGWQNLNGTPLPNYSDIEIVYDFTCNTCNNSSMSLDLKVFLEGSYNPSNGEMTNYLQEQNLIPLTQPYSTPPWEHEEMVTFNNSTDLPPNIVDWVLVEIRSGTPATTGINPNTILEQAKVGFLQKNGTVIAPTGNSLIFEELTIGEMYYVLVRHRNHLDILSSTPITASSTVTYDFTINSTQAFGTSQQKLSIDGKAMMYAGDYLPDGVLQNSDNDEWLAIPAILNTYSLTDGTLDGIVQLTDQDAWLPNKAKIGTIEIRY